MPLASSERRSISTWTSSGWDKEVANGID
jgi:hypothetical protein